MDSWDIWKEGLLNSEDVRAVPMSASLSIDLLWKLPISLYNLFHFHFQLGVRIGTTPGYFIIVPLLLTVLCASGFQQLEVKFLEIGGKFQII